MTTLEWLSLILTIVGAVSSILYLYELYNRRRRIRWSRVKKAARHTVEKMNRDSFNPTLIVGISRGGAIFGALVSGALGYRPFIAVTARHNWEKNERSDELIFKKLNMKKELLESVLIVVLTTFLSQVVYF